MRLTAAVAAAAAAVAPSATHWCLLFILQFGPLQIFMNNRRLTIPLQVAKTCKKMKKMKNVFVKRSLLLLAKTITHPAARSLCDS